MHLTIHLVLCQQHLRQLRLFCTRKLFYLLCHCLYVSIGYWTKQSNIWWNNYFAASITELLISSKFGSKDVKSYYESYLYDLTSSCAIDCKTTTQCISWSGLLYCVISSFDIVLLFANFPMKAIMKLACQSHKRMGDLSSLWVPPIYRRLLSADKPERDMAERCLMKVSHIILPPQPLLFKVTERPVLLQII
jgi:hypothetical protein